MKVQNFDGRNGKVKNQFIITDGNKTIFQSYDSVIAIKENGKITLDEKFWDYSTTTGKYRNQFLNEEKKDTEKKIASGEYVLANLNQH
jgi:hypothetical protein